jgi:hypothetical protein
MSRWKILLLGVWRKIRYEMLWLRLEAFGQFQKRQTRRLLLRRLPATAFRLGLDIQSLFAKGDLDSKDRVVGRPSPLEKSVGGQSEMTGLCQELQGGLRVQGRGNRGESLLHDDTQGE